MKGTKTIPQADVEFDITEIHIQPGQNLVTITAAPNVGGVQQVIRTTDITERVDALSAAKLNDINDLFRRLVALGLGVDHTAITGDIFTKST